MPKPTPGFVKNLIRRSFLEIADQGPSKKEINIIWDYFDSTCAYCGRKLNRSLKEGHIDHLVPTSKGGSNHISNRVLSCASCNEKEKLDMDWEQFLKQKISHEKILATRYKKISHWQKLNRFSPNEAHKHFVAMAKNLADEVIVLYDEKVDRLRKLRKQI